MPPPLYVGVEQTEITYPFAHYQYQQNATRYEHYFVHNPECVAKLKLGGSDTTTLHIAHDSVVKFTGDAIVNAANEGCLGGGGHRRRGQPPGRRRALSGAPAAAAPRRLALQALRHRRRQDYDRGQAPVQECHSRRGAAHRLWPRLR
eukprot:1328096-Prymnesium_polylepis.2